MSRKQTTIIPHTQEPYVTRTHPSPDELDAAIETSAKAQKDWAKVALMERIALGRRFMEEFEKMSNDIAKELTIQMGRPIKQTPGEVKGMLGRADHLLSIAPDALKDVALTETDKPGFCRFIRRTPFGVTLVIAPWNYPYLTMINSVLPSLLAGNSVLLKPSPQTPVTAERMAEAFTKAGLPKDVLQVLHLSPDLVKHAIKHQKVNYISFTGSVAGGRDVDKAAAETGDFKTVGLELGGNDPAYVRQDAKLDYTVAELVDGALFNSGQSCCAVERIYVHESLYDTFVEKFVEAVKAYKLGNPLHEETNLGPVVSVASAERIRKQVADAVAAGARALIPEDHFPAAKSGTTYVAPQVLVDVNHTMDVVMEETFGPIVPIMKVSSDEEAIKLMNDSPYGLTASVWTKDAQAFEHLVDNIEAGTVFQNRCDFLDPALAWTGLKKSGRGISLSKYGFDQLTKAKSVHIKTIS